MHIALPFPLPTEKCVEFNVELGKFAVEFGIYANLDEVFYTERSGDCMWTISRLIEKDQKTPHLAGCRRSRLKAVAVFKDKAKYYSIKEAFAESSEKFDRCFDYLRSYLIKLQTFAPFECSWLVYPITTFDLSSVFHSVSAQHKNGKSIQVMESVPQWCLGRGNTIPQFKMAAPGPQDVVEPLLVTPYELLAEGLFALARGMPRMCVLNSFNAVEVLIGAVYEKKRVESLVSSGLPESEAGEIAENERRNPKKGFCNGMLHVGMREAYGRSLHDEDENLYNRFVKVNELRRSVVHHGFTPNKVAAKEAYKTSCEVLAWSAKIAGLAVKPYSPAAKGGGLMGKASC